MLKWAVGLLYKRTNVTPFFYSIVHKNQFSNYGRIRLQKLIKRDILKIPSSPPLNDIPEHHSLAVQVWEFAEGDVEEAVGGLLGIPHHHNPSFARLHSPFIGRLHEDGTHFGVSCEEVLFLGKSQR